MPMSSSACPSGSPPVTSFRPSRLATREAGAAVGSPGTVIPASGVTWVLAPAAPTARVAEAAVATRAAPMPRARRRFVLLDMVIVLPDLRPTHVSGPHPVARRSGGRRPTGKREKGHSHLVNRIDAAYVSGIPTAGNHRRR